MQATHSFYKHLVKNDVTKIRDILVRAQKYMQIEKATRGATNRPPKQKSEGEKPEQQFLMRKTPSHCSVAVYKEPRHMRKLSKDGAAEPDLIPFWIPINQLFNAIKDQPGSASRTTSLVELEGTRISRILHLP